MTYKNPYEGLNIILDFGIVHFARKCEYDLEQVGKQLLYAYHNKKRIMQADLKRLMKKYANSEELLVDLDYRGFDGDGKIFDPLEYSGESLSKLFESDLNFKEMAILRYQIEQVEGLSNIRDFNIDSTINNYEKGLAHLKTFETKFGADCTPMIKPSQIIDFRDSGKELDLFRAYIGIRSLIGQHKYVLTTRNVILMRMLGCKSNDALQGFISSDKEAKKVYEMYSRSEKALRYNFDKLFAGLLSKGFLKSKIYERKISRKIFLSITMSYDELTDAIIEFSRQRNFKKDEQKAKDKIRATI